MVSEETASLRGADYRPMVRALKDSVNWTCQHCGWQPPNANERVAILVHHKNSDPLDQSPENLEVICSNCHDRQHGGRL